MGFEGGKKKKNLRGRVWAGPKFPIPKEFQGGGGLILDFLFQKFLVKKRGEKPTLAKKDK